MTDLAADVRLTAALAALLNPQPHQVDRAAHTDADRQAITDTRTRAARDHHERARVLRDRHARARATGDKAGMRRALAALIELETRHRDYEAGRTATSTVRPALLEQLHDAVQSSTSSGGAASAGAHRSPIGLAAAELVAGIRSTVGGRAPRPATRTDPGDDPVALLTAEVRSWAAHRHDDPTAATAAEDWLTQARAILEPPRWSEAQAACPACGTRHVWVSEDGERVQKAAIQINLSQGIAACIAPACKATWPKERWPLLAAALVQDTTERRARERRAPRRMPT